MVSLTKTKKYFITTVLTFIAAMASDQAYVMESTETMEPFSSDEIRCALVMENEMYSKSGLATGFNYELLSQFAKSCMRDAEIVTAKEEENYFDSLALGTIDIVVVTHDAMKQNLDCSISIKTGHNSAWAVRKGDLNKIKIVNSWIRHYEMTDEYKTMESKFFSSYSPSKAESGKKSTRLSPYDEIIKKNAKKLGWDWRMLAAVIYQESKFAINSNSGRGATGLMQIKPSTAEHYGIHDLIDPEENIKAGVLHLKRLQNMYRCDDMDEMERIRFTLASYNAGEGRIMDCRNLAADRGYDKNKWENVLKVIPEMRTDSILNEDCVKLGKFQGHETISYIDSIMDIYDCFCKICPQA